MYQPLNPLEALFAPAPSRSRRKVAKKKDCGCGCGGKKKKGKKPCAKKRTRRTKPS